MKLLLIIVVSVIGIRSDDDRAERCFPWPENLLTLRDCCHTPNPVKYILLDHCYSVCQTSANLSSLELNDCTAKCYGNYTLLISNDGKLNKNIAKRILNENSGHDAKWMDVIDKSVNFCNFDEGKPLMEGLAIFYECVNDELALHCVQFSNTIKCDMVVEYFEACAGIQPNCDQFPTDLKSFEDCCKSVPLFNAQLHASCRKKCVLKELIRSRKFDCIENCLFDDSKVVVDGKFDFATVRTILLDNSRDNLNWTVPIESAVLKCETKLQEMENSNTSDKQKKKFLLTCLQALMSEECVDFYSDSSCNKLRRFLQKCPGARPKISESSQKSEMKNTKS